MQSITSVYNKVVVCFDKNVAGRKKNTDDPEKNLTLRTLKKSFFLRTQKDPITEDP